MSASKKAKKQDVSSSDDGFESYVRDCLQAIRQDIEEIKIQRRSAGGEKEVGPYRKVFKGQIRSLGR